MEIVPTIRYFQGSVVSSLGQLNLFKQAVIDFSKDKKPINPLAARFLSWTPSDRELAFWTLYAENPEDLPFELDCVFDLSDPNYYELTAIRVVQSIWNGYFPLGKVDRGHKHLLIVELISEGVFPTLLSGASTLPDGPVNPDLIPSPTIGLCQLRDLNEIQIQNHN